MKKIILLILIISTLLLSSCRRADDIFLVNKDSFKEYSETLKYEDLRFPVSQIRVTGVSNLPKYAVFINNTQALYFSPGDMEQAFITMQTPHNRISNTTLYPHFHWSYDEPKAVGDVVWCVEYNCANVGGYYYEFMGMKCTTDSARDPYEHHMTPMIEINNTLEESAICNMRIFRDGTHVNDTLPVAASLQEFDVHYLSYQIGEDNHFD